MNHKTHQPHLSTARDARAVRTREALRRAMLDLLEVKSLDQITFRDIAAAAGVGYTTFFRHHPSKDACLDNVAAFSKRVLNPFSVPFAAKLQDVPNRLVVVLSQQVNHEAARNLVIRHQHADR